MKVEIRADSVCISGYVNVTGKMSRPVITGKGQKVIEIIEERAFAEALSRCKNVQMTKDHDETVVLAETRAGTLKVHEDKIGLYAVSEIKDQKTIEEARAGKIKGWSFGMKNITDSIEQRADALPVRHVKKFDLDHITLVVNKCPVYAATSVEVRADDETVELECRAMDDECDVINHVPKKKFDNSEYRERLEKLSRE